VATVNASTGDITTVAGGSATITATTSGGKTATAALNVVIPVTGINLSPSPLNLNRGDQQIITVTYTPSITSETGVEWISSDPSVATVTNGTVTARAGGTATITAKSTARPDISAACTVNVIVALTGIDLPPAITMGVGNNVILPAAYSPSDTTQTGLTWTSTSTGVATVSDGTIHAVSPGTTNITAISSTNGSIYATCIVTVQSTFNGAGVTIEFKGLEDENITVNGSNGTNWITVIAPEGFDRYLWYSDLFYSYQTTTTPGMNLYVWGLTPGLHYLTVIVEKGGNHFSKTLTYKVGY
jgi:uncharacterized protein YjdB